MKKIGIIVGLLMCILIVSATAVSAAEQVNEDVCTKKGTDTSGDGSSSCTSDCGSENDEPSYQDSNNYLIYLGM
jgi:hypothetical protein